MENKGIEISPQGMLVGSNSTVEPTENATTGGVNYNGKELSVHNISSQSTEGTKITNNTHLDSAITITGSTLYAKNSVDITSQGKKSASVNIENSTIDTDGDINIGTTSTGGSSSAVVSGNYTTKGTFTFSVTSK